MLRVLCAVLYLLTAPAFAAMPAPQASDDKVLKALDAWLKAYRAGKIDFVSKLSVLDKSVAAKYGLLGEGFIGDLNAASELNLLLKATAALDTAEAMAAVLEVAAVGLDDGKYDHRMAPQQVREMGESYLRGFKSNEARQQLLLAARGELDVKRKLETAVQAAALRGIGMRQERTFRSAVEQQLGAGEARLRLAASDSLGWLGDVAAVDALAAALLRETDETVLIAQVAALRTLLAEHADKPEPAGAAGEAGATRVPLPATARLAVRAVIGALGRGSWRVDMDLCAFLAAFRSGEAIPALIDVLQRFHDHPEQVQSGLLSGLLLHRAHELLVELTGAVYPADQPQQWRELWQREQAALTAAAERPPKPAPAQGTVSSGFFGIPVQGTRILFVVDLSASMNFPMHGLGTSAGGSPAKVATRLDFAKRELKRAVQALPDASSFNFITYGGDPKSRAWQKNVVPSTAKNKERALAFLDAMQAEGGTNMWAGLEEALKMKSLVYGDRYDTAVDELFLVSDGAPTVGAITDPIEILRIVTETNRFSKVRINTIFITSPNERDPREMAITPAELMRRMAEQNGGRFVKL